MRLFAFDRLDRYTLRLFLGPLAGVLVVLLIAQSLERLLRLFDLAASAGAPLSSVVVMFANLIPHYLGLSLPMAFTAAIFMAAARLGDDSELDVMLSAGRSLARVAAPFFVVGVMLIPFDLYLFGELQPITRYGYRAAVDAAMQTGWDAKVEENRFINAGHGTIFGAAVVSPDGKHLTGVFVERREPNKIEVTTAVKGEFVRADDGHGLFLRLDDGQRLLEGKNDTVAVERFVQGRVDRDLVPEPKPFRDRGDSAREQTLPELWVAMKAARKAAHASARAASAASEAGSGARAPASAARSSTSTKGTSKAASAPTQPPKALNAKSSTSKNAADALGYDPKPAAEFHGRLAHVLILPILPLLALPLGMASKRGRRAPGVIFGILALLLLHHLLQFGQSLAENGRLPAAVAVWTPFAFFALLSLWIFRGSLAWPGDNPVLRAVMLIERSFEGIKARTRRAPTEAGGGDGRDMSGVLGRYFRRRIGMQILGLLAVLTALMQLLELLDMTTDILKRGLGLKGLAYYAWLRTPGELVLALPIAVLLGSMMAFYAMARSLEITTIRSAGVSLKRIFMYLLPVLLVFSAIQFALSDRVLPGFDNTFKEWWAASAPPDDEITRLWVYTDGGPVSIERISPDGKKLDGVRLYLRDAKGLISGRVAAAHATWKGGQWTFQEVSRIDLGDGKVTHTQEPTRAWKTNLTPDEVLRLDVSRPHLSSMMLADVIAGTRVGTQPMAYYRTVLYRSFTAPLAVFVMVLLALPMACWQPRGSSGGKEMLVPLLLGLAFLLCDGIVSAIGTSGRLSPLVTAAVAPLVFIVLGIFRLQAYERI